MHWPGIEPRSTAWKAAMLTITPPMLCYITTSVLKILRITQTLHIYSDKISNAMDLL